MIYTKPACSRRSRRVRRGASVTEMAVILPIVLVLLLGTIDFAQVMYAYGTVSEAARAGARYAIVHGSMAASPVGPSANDATVASVVTNNAPALNSAQLTVASSWPTGSNRAGCQVSVSASYTCAMSVGKLIGLNSVTVTGSTTMLITH